jgi:hypothetical protein
MKNFLKIFFIILLTTSCEGDKDKLPVGFELISSDGGSHFVYVRGALLGDRISQREAGRIICNGIFNTPNYCEVYYFQNKAEVPKKFPIMNKINPFGLFEMKNGKEKFKLLYGQDGEEARVFR